MKRFTLALALATIGLLALAGCQKPQPIDPKQYNAADWEKRMSDPSLSEDEFTRLYALAAAAELKGTTVRVVGKREVSIKFDDGAELRAILDNAWTEAARDAGHRAEICRRYLAALRTSRIGRGADAAPPETSNIVAVVRDDLFLKQFEKMDKTGTNHLVSERLVADLNVIYASDREGAIAYLIEKDRRRLGLDLSALRQLALTNLNRILPPPKLLSAGPLFVVVADGNYESSLLLSDEFWTGQALTVKGDLLAAVPSRGLLIFTGSASPDGVGALRQMTAKVYAQGDHVISRTILVRRNGRWEKFAD